MEEAEEDGGAAGSAAMVVVRNGPPPAVAGRLTDSVDRFLDASPAFAASLRQAFLQLAKPPLPAATSGLTAASLSLPGAFLLPALNSLQQKLTEGMDPKLWRLSLRNFTYCDIQALVEQKAGFDPYTAIEFKDFEWAARQAFKNMAMDKSRRVGFYMLGGMVVVHLVHGMVRKVPYIGKHMGFLVRVLSPTLIVGPLLGVAGASCWEEKILRQMLPL